ncbi:MAG TPA: polysaccharide lyase beta-sandwich domain-containing protein, partial [Bacteroidales bacterium]|nr:polysaccharide lyase beta-sandwich domain-containing protein [Bacteroidales bacterium]
RGEVFKLWVDHGKRPKGASYQYVVLPSVSEKDLEIFSQNNPLEIVANNKDIQGVWHKGLQIAEVVFYSAGDIQIDGGIRIAIDSPGVMLVKTVGGVIKSISVADPSRKLKRIHLTINKQISSGGNSYSVLWDKERGISEVAIDLPETVYAGSTTTINF